MSVSLVCALWGSRCPLPPVAGTDAIATAWAWREISAHRPGAGDNRRVATVYVTGHRNPDTDSIASAIGYAEMKGRLDPENDYVPVRLGDCNAQTRWLLER